MTIREFNEVFDFPMEQYSISVFGEDDRWHRVVDGYSGRDSEEPDGYLRFLDDEIYSVTIGNSGQVKIRLAR